MKYLILLILTSPLFLLSQKAEAFGQIDSVYADSIYADIAISITNPTAALKKPDHNYAQLTGIGPTMDIAFKKPRSSKIQNIKANSKILIWGKKDPAADSSAAKVTLWFDDGSGIAYNTGATPVYFDDTLKVINVDGRDYTYIEVSLAQNEAGKGATSFFIDAIAVVEDTTTPLAVRTAPSMVNAISSYPNPFFASTTIHFELETEGDIELAVVDGLGREVDHVNAGYLQQGSHEIPLAIKSPGFYFVRVLMNGQPVGNPLKINSR
ncbi:MAG: T9SS type A sorting domain-containing protein [Bacteroidota bacterium]|nr:T9SS type A sorting domain-containing protein [Bacteroidota bacterium]MDP4228798.1 T9SS type A sorting domain-containing protein [Bacteroidota bacterium]MDP4237186.1 T9SS type A sorting domain-containing protein [Bacteroidota bacterium]